MAVGSVKGATMNPCRSFRLTYVEFTSLAGVLKVNLQNVGEVSLLRKEAVVCLRVEHNSRPPQLLS